MKYLTVEEIANLNSEDARKFIYDAGNAMLGKSAEEINKIKEYFIELLNQPKLYDKFSFGEIVNYFTYENEHFNDEEKEKILSYINKHFEEFCAARNEMVSFTLFDFIIREIKQETRKKYAYFIKKKKENFTREELRCIEIIENGFPDFDITTYD